MENYTSLSRANSMYMWKIHLEVGIHFQYFELSEISREKNTYLYYKRKLKIHLLF